MTSMTAMSASLNNATRNVHYRRTGTFIPGIARIQGSGVRPDGDRVVVESLCTLAGGCNAVNYFGMVATEGIPLSGRCVVLEDGCPICGHSFNYVSGVIQ